MRVLEKQTELDGLKTRLHNTWMTGDYGRFSRYMERDAEAFYRRLPIEPGTQLLDVACGAGQLSLIAARAGVRVTGCDIASNWLVQARRNAAAEGLTVVFEEGDAEALPYGDATFDAVVSLIGAMFAPRPELVAAESTRVCRHGGLIAMANWTGAGFVGQMFKTIAKYIAPSGMPSPLLWAMSRAFASGSRVASRVLSARATCTNSVIRFHRRMWSSFSAGLWADDLRLCIGRRSSATATSGRADRSVVTSQSGSTDGTTKVDAEYLQVVAVRGESERTHAID